MTISLSYTKKPKGHSTPGVASQVMSGGERSPLSPAGNSPNEAQDIVGLCSMSTLLACVQPPFQQDLQVLSC